MDGQPEGRESGNERVNLFRNGAVGFIDLLGGLPYIIHPFPLPRAFNRMANSHHLAGRSARCKIKRSSFHCFMERNDSAGLTCGNLFSGVITDVHEFSRFSVVTSPFFHWLTAVIPTHFVRTVVGIVISFHLPGLKAHSLNAFVLAASRIEEPVDLIIAILLTLPVLRSRSSRYMPLPRRLRVQVRGSRDHD
jgi:hypothetical protein